MVYTLTSGSIVNPRSCKSFINVHSPEELCIKDMRDNDAFELYHVRHVNKAT